MKIEVRFMDGSARVFEADTLELVDREYEHTLEVTTYDMVKEKISIDTAILATIVL
mgnify:CR=1 FL=1